MARQTTAAPQVKSTLGLTGVTVNAMALIAPGAFLWITYQLQAAATAPDGSSVATDIWAGIGLALILAFLTAFSYAELMRRYPEAGFGSSYYFAEKAFIDRAETRHHRWARLAKILTGWSAHLYYWVYPGVMVAMTATLLGYIWTQVTGGTLSMFTMDVICVLFAILVGFIAWRGVSGSTVTAFTVNVIQLVTLVVFSLLAIWYRWSNPVHATQWAFSGAWDVVRPHSFQGVLIQSTLAILILVGFESCTALAAETIDPKKHIPRGVILSLIIQGLFAYMFEYFAGSYMVNETLTATDPTGATVTGMAAAGVSSAPIGDMAILLGNTVLGGIGFGLMVSIAVTVVIALLGTTLSCLNTAVRMSYAMAQDREMPEILGVLHGRFATPHRIIWVLVAFSAVIGWIGVWSNPVGLTGITLASNFGTFALYGLTCLWTMVAFAGTAEFKFVRHAVVPALGLLANVVMLIAILYLYVIGNADAQHEAYICFSIAGAWALVSVLYVLVTSVRSGRPLVAPAPRRVA
jgi:amino acid transporter